MRLRKTKTIAGEYASLRADYAAARPSRFRRTRTALGGTADAHYSEASLWTIREYSRDMVRNDDAPGTLVDGIKRNILQDRGLVLEPKTGDEKLDSEIGYRWNDWCNDAASCDARGMNSWWHLEQLVLEALIVDGDTFALPLESGEIQLVEAELCSSPTTANTRGVVCGIVHDRVMRRPVEYWFLGEGDPVIGGRRTIGQYRQVPAFDEEGQPNVFHVLDTRRISQSRGVPAFAPVFDTLGMFEDVNFAALVQQQMVSCIAAFFVNTDGGDLQMGSRQTQTAEDGTTETLEALSPGMTLRLRPGEDVRGFSPNVPAPAYFDLCKSVLRRICARLGVPPEIAFFDTTDTTFHGYRGAVDQARVGFQRTQRNLALRLHTPAYRWKVRQWLPALGAVARRLARKGDLFRHEWKMPGWRYVDPLKDAQADALQLQNMLDSPRGLVALRGRDFETITDETVADREMAIRKAIDAVQSIASDTGVHVSWRDVLNLAAPENYRITAEMPPETHDSDTEETP